MTLNASPRLSLGVDVNQLPPFKTVTLILAALTLLAGKAECTPTIPSPPGNIYVNLTTVAPRQLVSFVAHGFERPLSCDRSDAGDATRQQDEDQLPGVCPSEVVTEGTSSLPLVDPKRIPREIRQVRCLRIHCRGIQAGGDSAKPCCQEHNVTIPVLHCDMELNENMSNSVKCSLTLHQIVDSCVCMRGQSGR